MEPRGIPPCLGSSHPTRKDTPMTQLSDCRWHRDSRHEFALLTPEGDEVCIIFRAHPPKPAPTWEDRFHTIADTSKPMIWTLQTSLSSPIPTQELGADLTVREAKKRAENILFAR